jgi:two-component system response regulator YesN
MLLNLVVVDDEQFVIEEITKIILNFKKQKFRIVGIARNGKEGIELVKQLKPDIIICDVKMPVMNGLDMVKNCGKMGSAPRWCLSPAWILSIRLRPPSA